MIRHTCWMSTKTMYFLMITKTLAMKRLFKLISLSLMMFLIGIETISAQSNKQQITREQLSEVQARYIADKVGMNVADRQRFVETYKTFQKEVWALGPRGRQRSANMTDAQTEEAIKKRFERSQKILSIREKYYEVYSQFLTQKQIQQVYMLEKQVMNRLAKQRRNNRR